MLDFRLHQRNGQQAQDLHEARWEGLLFPRRMLDSCTQERWQLFQTYQEIESQSYYSTFNSQVLKHVIFVDVQAFEEANIVPTEYVGGFGLPLPKVME